MLTKSNDQSLEKTISKDPTLPSTSAPVYTIADLQQNSISNGPIIIGDIKSGNIAEIFNEILVLVTKDAKRKFWCIFLCWLLPLFPFSLLIFPCCYFYQYRQNILALKNVGDNGLRYIIRLEGDQWSRYVVHINAGSSKRMKQATIKKFIARRYGHIFLSSEGFLLDALLCTAYQNMAFVRSEVIKAPNDIDMMLRIWFCKRISSSRNGQYVTNDPFKFDIFLPSHMSTEHLSSIRHFIAHESNCKPYNTAVI